MEKARSTISIRLNNRELIHIGRKAKKMDLPLSSYIRHCAIMHEGSDDAKTTEC